MTPQLPQQNAPDTRSAEDRLRESEERLRQSQKLEAVGQLAGGVAHDFNNLLAVIIGYVGMVLDGTSPTDPMREHLLEIRSAGERASELTRQLLAFSRRQVLQPKVHDLNEIVAGVAKMLRRVIGEDVLLSTHPCAGDARAFVDAGQVEQVLLNLALNARNAMPNGGKLSITVGRDAVDITRGAELGLSAGEFRTLSVTDTGPGMDAATRARIFEPFFTTNPVGKGSGLGLSTVLGIVQQSGGQVTVDTEPGRGSTFRAWFPAGTTEETAKPEAQWEGALDGTETILVVEDEDVVRKLITTVLTKRGYRVLGARSGGDALALCESHTGPIDLVLTDLVMPLMSGEETVARVSAARPGIRAAYMSGYIKEHAEGRATTVPEPLIEKPFTPDELLRRVREVLA